MTVYCSTAHFIHESSDAEEGEMSAKVYASVVCKWQGNQIERRQWERHTCMAVGSGNIQIQHTYVCTHVHTKHFKKKG